MAAASAGAGRSSPRALASHINSDSNSTVSTPSASPPPSLREAPFALNRDKQVRNLVSEASSLTEPYVSTEVKNLGLIYNFSCGRFGFKETFQKGFGRI